MPLVLTIYDTILLPLLAAIMSKEGRKDWHAKLWMAASQTVTGVISLIMPDMADAIEKSSGGFLEASSDVAEQGIVDGTTVHLEVHPDEKEEEKEQEDTTA